MPTNNCINTTYPISVDTGGTGVSTLTAHGVLLGQGTGAITTVMVGMDGQVLTAATGADPSFDAIGTLSGLTAHSVVLAQGPSAFTALGVATNGELIIGSTGADPVLAHLTAGAGISITNGAGSITVASSISQGIVTLNGNSGSATGTTVTIAGGNNITTAASGAMMTVQVSGTTNHAVQIGNSSGSLSSLSVGTTGQVLTATSSADPAFADLGTNSGLTAHSLLLGQNNSAITALGAATNGQIPIGSTGADPVLAALTAGSGISVTNGAGSITIANTQTQGIVTLNGDSGSATGTTVTLAGGNNVTTSATGSTVTFNVSGTTNHAVQLGNSSGALTSLTVGTNGQVLTGVTSSNPSFSALGTNSGLTAHSLLLGQGNSAITALGAATNGQIPIGSTSADPVLATITAGSNISITNGAGSISAALVNSPSVSGSLTAGTTITATSGAITATAGDVVITAGNLTLANTNSSGTQGIIKLGGNNFLHDFGSFNTFLGAAAGNTTLTTGSALGNCGIGTQSLTSLTTGEDNAGLGYASLFSCTSGSFNMAIGVGALELVTTGSANVAIGYLAGDQYTSNESSNVLIGSVGVTGDQNLIRIGNQGSGSQQQNQCFIAGITGVTVASAAAVLLNTSTGQMGTIVSSQRFKERITDMGDRSSRVMDLRPVNFAYKNDESHGMQWGLIAEEVAQVMPELVTFDLMGVPYTVRYHDMPAILLNEMQKMAKRIELLESKLQETT
jgi:hypothetical protein